MPRTKRVSKKRNYSNVSTGSQSSDGKSSLKSNQNNLMIADINRNFDAQMSKLDKQLENSIALLKRAYDIAIFQIPTTMLNKPPRDCLEEKDEDYSSDSPKVSSTMNHVSPPVTQSRQHERLAIPSVPNTNRPRTRNSSKNNGHGDEQTTLMPPPTNNRFRTPNCNIGAGGRYNQITPKVQPNSAMSILRRPRGGEMALSMCGSPLLVSAITRDNMANVNVPLPDGTVITLLPQAGLGPHVPQVDVETVEQLKRLKENLASFLDQQF